MCGWNVLCVVKTRALKIQGAISGNIATASFYFNGFLGVIKIKQPFKQAAPDIQCGWKGDSATSFITCCSCKMTTHCSRSNVATVFYHSNLKMRQRCRNYNPFSFRVCWSKYASWVPDREISRGIRYGLRDRMVHFCSAHEVFRVAFSKICTRTRRWPYSFTFR